MQLLDLPACGFKAAKVDRRFPRHMDYAFLREHLEATPSEMYFHQVSPGSPPSSSASYKAGDKLTMNALRYGDAVRIGVTFEFLLEGSTWQVTALGDVQPGGAAFTIVPCSHSLAYAAAERLCPRRELQAWRAGKLGQGGGPYRCARVAFHSVPVRISFRVARVTAVSCWHAVSSRATRRTCAIGQGRLALSHRNRGAARSSPRCGARWRGSTLRRQWRCRRGRSMRSLVDNRARRYASLMVATERGKRVALRMFYFPVLQVPMRAGDTVVFNPACLHSASRQPSTLGLTQTCRDLAPAANSYETPTLIHMSTTRKQNWTGQFRFGIFITLSIFLFRA
jgi:hypothetical protein